MREKTGEIGDNILSYMPSLQLSKLQEILGPILLNVICNQELKLITCSGEGGSGLACTDVSACWYSWELTS